MARIKCVIFASDFIPRTFAIHIKQSTERCNLPVQATAKIYFLLYIDIAFFHKNQFINTLCINLTFRRIETGGLYIDQSNK